MSRFRMYPTPEQEQALLGHCAHARLVWNLAVEQQSWYRPFRVTRDRAGRWHVAFAAIPDPAPAPGDGSVVGVDRGVAATIATSDGTADTCPGLTGKESERLFRLQRRAARQHRRGRPPSNRLRATRTAIARLKATEADRRKDWVERTSTHLARSFDLVRVEDLDVRHMTRSASGTAEAPGSNVRQKAGLNRSILAAGWGMLATRLEQKAPGRVEKIPAAYTSQRCSNCRHVAAESRESQAVFRCLACRVELHADVNAAINIAAGRAVTAHGDLQGLPGSVKCEPLLAAA